MTLFMRLSLSSPVVLGYLPVAIVFGLLAHQHSFSLWFTLSSSIFVYAGASQFLALTLIASSAGNFPSNFSQIVGAIGLLNLRHFFLSLGYLPLARSWTMREKLCFFPLLTDETFAVLTQNPKAGQNPRVAIGSGFIHYLSWILGTLIGYFFGNLIPSPETWGLDFVLTALFVGILFLMVKRKSDLVNLIATAATSVVLIVTLGSKPNMFLIAALVGSLLGNLWENKKWN